jgi:hypothetical protein
MTMTIPLTERHLEGDLASRSLCDLSKGIPVLLYGEHAWEHANCLEFFGTRMGERGYQVKEAA